MLVIVDGPPGVVVQVQRGHPDDHHDSSDPSLVAKSEEKYQDCSKQVLKYLPLIAGFLKSQNHLKHEKQKNSSSQQKVFLDPIFSQAW